MVDLLWTLEVPEDVLVVGGVVAEEVSPCPPLLGAGTLASNGHESIVRSPKFRWMGHATLLLTTVYMLMVGTRQFEPVYRVLSFLVLGTVLLVVSMVFSRLRRPRAQ